MSPRLTSRPGGSCILGGGECGAATKLRRKGHFSLYFSQDDIDMIIILALYDIGVTRPEVLLIGTVLYSL